MKYDQKQAICTVCVGHKNAATGFCMLLFPCEEHRASSLPA